MNINTHTQTNRAAQYARGDMVTIDLPNQSAIDKLIVLLEERGIEYRQIKLRDNDQILVSASNAELFADLARDIVNNEWSLGCKYDLGTFQGEFLTAVYDDQRNAFVSYWEPVNYIPSIADLDAGRAPDEPEYNIPA